MHLFQSGLRKRFRVNNFNGCKSSVVFAGRFYSNRNFIAIF